MKKRRYVAINLLLYSFLYLSVTFNKEVIRPIYGHTPIIGILTGSFSNFMAAYILSLFSIAPIFAKNIETKKARVIVYTVSILVFFLLAIEEIRPFVSASSTYDVYDVVASGLGAFLALLSFEFILKKRKK